MHHEAWLVEFEEIEIPLVQRHGDVASSELVVPDFLL